MSTYICHRASCEVEIDEDQASGKKSQVERRIAPMLVFHKPVQRRVNSSMIHETLVLPMLLEIQRLKINCSRY